MTAVAFALIDGGPATYEHLGQNQVYETRQVGMYKSHNILHEKSNKGTKSQRLNVCVNKRRSCLC